MRRVTFRFALLLLLVVVLAYSQSYCNTWNASALPPGFDFVDYEGLYVVKENEVDTIEGRFEIYGSLIVRDNATLILRNAHLQLYRPTERFGEPFTVRNEGRLVLEDSKLSTWRMEPRIGGGVTVAGGDSIILRGYALLNVSGTSSYILSAIKAFDESRVYVQDANFIKTVESTSAVSITDSSVEWVDVKNEAVFAINDSRVDILICRDPAAAAQVSVTGSEVKELFMEDYTEASIDIDESTIKWLEFGHHIYSSVSVHNSTIGLGLRLRESNLAWTTKPFFAEQWNIHRDTPLHTEGNLTLVHTNVDRISLSLSHSDAIFLHNSKLGNLNLEYSDVTVASSSIDSMSSRHSSVFLLDSTAESLWCYGAEATVINSIIEQIRAQNNGTVEVWWLLTVVVRDQVEDPKPNTVATIYDENRSLVAQNTVNAKGLTQFTLREKRLSDNESTHVGNYTLHVEYDGWNTERPIVLEHSYEISLTVIPFHIRLLRLLTTPVGIALSMVAIILAVTGIVLVRRKFYTQTRADVGDTTTTSLK